MVVVAIVGVLAAVSIPVFVRYIKDARVSEAVANVQSLMEAEQAYFARFQQYTQDLPWCPPALPPAINYETQVWPLAPDGSSPCGTGTDWTMLGWTPQQAVAFQYRVFSAFNDQGIRAWHPVGHDLTPQHPNIPDPPRFGVNWGTRLPGAGIRILPPDNLSMRVEMQPWCVVEAQGDTDVDGSFVFIRTNSINNAVYRCDDAGEAPGPNNPPTY